MKVGQSATKLLRNLEARDRMDGLRILVVEGDAGRAEQLLALLEAAGHSVTVISDLDEAAEALSIQRFELVLLASRQSVEGAADFVSKLRDLEAGQRSGSRATVLGCSPSLSEVPFLDGSLPQGFDADLLNEAVSGLQTTRERADARTEPVSVPLPVFASEQFEEQCAHDTGLMVEIIDLFSTEQSHELPAMVQALAKADFERLARLAHTLKGSLGALHAPLAWQRAQSLEMAAKDEDRPLCAAALEALNVAVADLNDRLSSFRKACLCL